LDANTLGNLYGSEEDLKKQMIKFPLNYTGNKSRPLDQLFLLFPQKQNKQIYGYVLCAE
jgi:hypothetical protein